MTASTMYVMNNIKLTKLPLQFKQNSTLIKANLMFAWEAHYSKP